MLEKNKFYKLSEFCKVLKESQEFNPRKGETVDKENKENNGKAVKDILQKTKDYNKKAERDDGIKNDTTVDTRDFNNTTLDYSFVNDPGEAYKKRVKAQVEGFDSVENKKNSKIKEENKGLDFEGNEKFYKERSGIAKDRSDRRKTEKTSGLKTSKKIDQDKDLEKDFEDKTIFENKKMKRLHFNKTVFLNEEHMLKKIPDDMKINGNKFYMKDSIGNEYLIECKADNVIKDVIHTNVIDYVNKEKINETFNRMKQLYDYNSCDTNKKTSINETEFVGKMISESKNKLFNNVEDTTDKFFKTLIGNDKQNNE